MKKVIYILSSLMLGITLMTLTSCEPDGPKTPDFEASHTLGTVLDAIYSPQNGIGVYSVTLLTSTLDQMGYPANVGDIQFTLNLNAPLDADPVNATIPDGTYTADTLMNEMTWNPLATGMYIRIGEGTGLDALGIEYMTDGTVYSKRDGDNYTLQIAFTTSGGTQINAEYKGPIFFTQGGGSGGYNTPPFTEDQNVKFNEADGTYYGLWAYPHADDATLRFYISEYASDGSTLLKTYRMNIMLFSEKLEDYNVRNPQIPTGTYNVTATKPFTDTAIPETIIPGSLDNIVGELIMTGSNFTMTDYEAGENFASHITGGSMTITNNGSEYDIQFNFTTPEEVSIKGSYKGAINIENRCTNDTDPTNPRANGQAISRLEEDVVVNIPEEEIAIIAYYGNYLFTDKASWFFSLGAVDEVGDFIMSEFFTEYKPFTEAGKLIPGTYNVSRTFEPYTMLPGFSTFGNYTPLYTWYGDLSSYNEAEGYHEKMAPIESGTMTVEDLGGGNYKFVFDFVDDAGFKVTGEWSGQTEVIDNDLTKPVEDAAIPSMLLYR